MFRRNQLSAAIIATTISSFSANVSAVLEEIIVTATKQSENLQDVAITVQALGTEALNQQNVGNFDDYISLLPNVTSGGRGPGQSAIYIRGMATDATSVANGEVAGTAPNVALYLDEQTVGTPSRNLDIYITDMERIEVLPGPQGTLFGASSQAGTIRLITNKPTLDAAAAGFKASVSSTAHGEMSDAVEGFVNIPIIVDKLAVRGVFYSVQEGGYIDNNNATFSLPTSNPAFPAGAEIQRFSNAEFAEDDFNSSSYKGFRGSLKYLINDDWSLLLQSMHQQLNADGVFDYDPEVGDLQVERYYTDELKDEFTQSSLTLNGRIGKLDVLYTGSYLDRDTEQRIDYSGYNAEGPFVPYYICDYPNYTVCGDPTYGYNGFINNTRETHEFRVNTPQEKALRVIAGIFYDDMELEADTFWLQPGLSDGSFPQNAPISTATTVNPNPRPIGVTFINDITRTEEQFAVFGELSYDLTEDLTFTVGARRYELEFGLAGSSNFAVRGATDGDSGNNIDARLEGESPRKISDTIFKFNASYTVSDDVMVYATWSEGFRPGGFNRSGGSVGVGEAEGILIPDSYISDTVKNTELGWKTTLLDGNMRFNGSLYFVEWSDMQVAIFNPNAFGNLTNTFNVGEAEIKGIEADLDWQTTDQLRLFAAFSYNDTELVSKPAFATNIIDVGEQLAFTPEFQGTVRARYSWEFGKYPTYWQLATTYSGKSFSSIVIADRFKQDSWVTVHAALGLQTEMWGAELFVENLTDERAELFINTQDSSKRIATNRPRTVGLRINYNF